MALTIGNGKMHVARAKLAQPTYCNRGASGAVGIEITHNQDPLARRNGISQSSRSQCQIGQTIGGTQTS